MIIADDNRMFLDSLTECLNKNPRLEVITSVNSIADVIKMTNYYTFDLLILDLSFKGVSSIEFLKEIRNKISNFKILLLTSYNNRAIETEAYDRGVDFFISKDTSISEFSKEVLNILDSNIQNHNHNNTYSLNDFTLKQIKIIQAIYNYTTEKDLAKEFGISINTLKDHKKKLFIKTNTRNNIELIKFGIKHKIIIV